jgi:uncharacterized small protein (DUF1192 family)
MALFDEDAVFGRPKAKPSVHVLGETLDELSAPELAERIECLKREIDRLEAAMRAREVTRQAAAAIFKS